MPIVDLNGMTAEEVSNRISGESRSLEYFTTNGYGNFESKDGAYSASFKLAIRRPSFTSVNIYGPFGMKVAQVKLTSDTLLVYNSLKNEVIIGKPTAANLRNFVMIDADGSSLSDLLMDLMKPVSHLENPTMTSQLDGNKLSFTYSSYDTVEVYKIDGRYMRTAEYTKLIDGKAVLRIKYSDFITVDNIPVPKSVWFEDLSHGISARLFYQNIAVNEKEVLELNVPADAKEVILN